MTAVSLYCVHTAGVDLEESHCAIGTVRSLIGPLCRRGVCLFGYRPSEVATCRAEYKPVSTIERDALVPTDLNLCRTDENEASGHAYERCLSSGHVSAPLMGTTYDSLSPFRPMIAIARLSFSPNSLQRLELCNTSR